MTCDRCQGTGRISVPYPPPCRGSYLVPCPCQYDAIVATAMLVPATQELVEQFINLARANYAEAAYGSDPPVEDMFEHDYKIIAPFLPYKW